MLSDAVETITATQRPQWHSAVVVWAAQLVVKQSIKHSSVSHTVERACLISSSLFLLLGQPFIQLQSKKQSFLEVGGLGPHRVTTQSSSLTHPHSIPSHFIIEVWSSLQADARIMLRHMICVDLITLPKATPKDL